MTLSYTGMCGHDRIMNTTIKKGIIMATSILRRQGMTLCQFQIIHLRLLSAVCYGDYFWDILVELSTSLVIEFYISVWTN